MWKAVVSNGETPFGPSRTWLDMSSRHVMSKIASAGVHVPRELATKIAELQGHMPSDKVAFYNRALGSFESFGINRNGDGFEESWLRRNHDTFVKNAHYYRHHVNKDPALGRGRPVASAYNDKTAMVDLVIVADRDKCLEQIQALESGKRVPTSMGCFAAGTMITMSDGTRKAIEDVVVGDEVITHLGRARRVTETHRRRYSGSMYSVRPEAGETIMVTEEHPFWSAPLSSMYKHLETHRRFVEGSTLSGDWAHAKCLEDRMLASPVYDDVVTPSFATESFARLLGYYLAEGHLLRDKRKQLIGIHLTVNVNDYVLEEIERLCDDLGTKNPPAFADHPHSSQSKYIYIHDERLAEMCKIHAGELAKSKRLSSDAMRWHPDVQRHIVGAYANGDGCGTDDGCLKLSTSSTNLAWQLTVLLPRIGVVPSIQNLEHKAGSGFSRRNTYEWVLHIGKQYAQTLRDVCQKIASVPVEMPRFTRRLMDDVGTGTRFIVTPIREISCEQVETEVFNFEVDEDESYVAGGMAVHNCKVAFDVCLICENKAPNRMMYCDHVKTGAAPPYGMGKVLADGRVCGVLNPDPKFFDISDVVIGAAAESETLMKVASVVTGDTVISGAHLAEIWGLSKVGDDKDASMSKRIPGEIDDVYHPLSAAAERIGEREADIPDSIIDEIRDRNGGLRGVLRSASAAGIVLKPHEFSRAAKLGHFNAPTLTEILSSESLPKNIISGCRCDQLAMEKMARMFSARSFFQPALVNRLSAPGQKTASRRVAEEDSRARVMYSAYRRGLIDVVNDDAGIDRDSEYWVIKSAETSSAYKTAASRAYVAHVFTGPGVKEKVLDRVIKVAGRLPVIGHIGPISGTMADSFGVEVLEKIAVESLRHEAWLPPTAF